METGAQDKIDAQEKEIQELRRRLAQAQVKITDLQDELDESNRGLLALSIELEDRVDQRTRELNAANRELVASIEELEKSREEARSQALFPQQNPNPVMRVSLEGEIMFANEACLPIINNWNAWHTNRIPKEWSDFAREVYGAGMDRHLDIKVGERYFSATFTPIHDADHVNIYAHEITSRITTEQALQRELKVNAALSSMAQDLLTVAPGRTKIAEIVLDYAKKITRSAHGLVSAINRQTGENVYYNMGQGIDPECKLDGLEKAMCQPREEAERYPALWGYCLNTHQGFYTNSPKTHAQAQGLPAGHIPVSAYLTVPVMLGDDLMGQIALANPDHEYDEHDLQSAEQLSGIYALALQKAQEEENRLEVEKKYRHSQKMEAIGTLAGGIAHDFNNILAAMLGYVNLSLHMLPKESPLEHNLRQIQKASNRARNLIKQILTVSRKGDREARPMDIAHVVKEVLMLIRATIPRSIELKQEISNDPGLVLADPVEIHQVVMNLCSNAAHAMGDNGGVLQVSLLSTRDGMTGKTRSGQPSSDQFIELRVSDTGRGINSEVLDRIFEPYFTTKDIHEGTGLGLSVVHGIVESLGGDIRVRSVENQGTVFSVYFPLCPVAQVVESESHFLKLGRGERILYVDDEKALVDIALQEMPLLGYQVTGFWDPQKALEAFKAEPETFDLIITDLHMPKLNGPALASMIKEIRQDIPIIMCTGYSEKADEVTARQYGLEAILSKPVDNHELVSAIRRLLDDSGGE